MAGWEQIVAAAITAGGQYASSVHTNDMNISEARKNRDWQEAMMDKANEWSSPVNVQAREQAAGWFRNAAGQGETQTPQSAQVGQVQNPLLQDPASQAFGSFYQLMSAYNQFSQGKTNMSLIEERVKNERSQSAYFEELAGKLNLESYEQYIVNQFCMAHNEVALMQGIADMNLTYRQAAHLDKDIEQMNQNIKTKMAEEFKFMSEGNWNFVDMYRVVAQIDSYQHQNNLMDAQAEEAHARAGLAEAETGLAEAQEVTENFKQDLLEAQTTQTGVETFDKAAAIKLYLDTYDDQIKEIAAKRKLTEKQVRWYAISQILGIVEDASVAFGAIGVGAQSLRTANKAASAAGKVIQEVKHPLPKDFHIDW